MTSRARCASCQFFVPSTSKGVRCTNTALAEQFAPQMASEAQLIQFMRPEHTDNCSLHQLKVHK